jgi:hypothetical protein
MSTLAGADDLKARFKALQTKVIGPAGKAWAEEAAKIARARVSAMNMPYSGEQARRKKPQAVLLPSIAVRKSKSKQKFIVQGSYHAYFVDAGVEQHSLTARSSTVKRAASEGRTIFARAGRKPHPGYRSRPFRGASAKAALVKHPVSETVVKAWNEAA